MGERERGRERYIAHKHYKLNYDIIILVDIDTIYYNNTHELYDYYHYYDNNHAI